MATDKIEQAQFASAEEIQARIGSDPVADACCATDVHRAVDAAAVNAPSPAQAKMEKAHREASFAETVRRDPWSRSLQRAKARERERMAAAGGYFTQPPIPEIVETVDAGGARKGGGGSAQTDPITRPSAQAAPVLISADDVFATRDAVKLIAELSRENYKLQWEVGFVRAERDSYKTELASAAHERMRLVRRIDYLEEQFLQPEAERDHAGADGPKIDRVHDNALRRG
ncbi:MAG: hypothetical protein WC683_06955 [bacterium]